MIITIGSSDVAACIGLNPYKRPEEVFTTLLAKHCPDKKIVTKDAEAEALLAKTAMGSSIVSCIKNTAGRVAPELLQTSVKEGLDKIELTELTPAEKKQVKDYIQSKANTIQGTHFEKGTAQSVELAESTQLMEDHTLYRHTLVEYKGYTFQLVGKIDRLHVEEDGTKTLIEIKNRVNRLFYKVKDYENIQVQCYLQLLDLERAKLIEHYKKEDTLNTLLIVRDRDMWEGVIRPKLVEFYKTLYTALVE
jgi:hypothetical protein